MRGTSGLSPARNFFRRIYPTKGSGAGTAATSVPKKQSNNTLGEEAPKIRNEEADPIVAFGRPPLLPPVMGPLVVLSLFQTWSSQDSNDD
ncbi:hypothetical protein NMG60_11027051 [Bertholletia excelsa]